MKTIEVVAAIIIRDHRILATMRGYGNYKGYWEFPGGKIEAGETKEAALIREISEELDVSIIIEEFFSTIEYDYPEFHLTMHCYRCSLSDDSEIKLLEHQDAKWLLPNELDTVEWLPADAPFIHYLKDLIIFK